MATSTATFHSWVFTAFSEVPKKDYARSGLITGAVNGTPTQDTFYAAIASPDPNVALNVFGEMELRNHRDLPNSLPTRWGHLSGLPRRLRLTHCCAANSLRFGAERSSMPGRRKEKPPQ